MDRKKKREGSETRLPRKHASSICNLYHDKRYSCGTNERLSKTIRGIFKERGSDEPEDTCIYGIQKMLYNIVEIAITEKDYAKVFGKGHLNKVQILIGRKGIEEATYDKDKDDKAGAEEWQQEAEENRLSLTHILSTFVCRLWQQNKAYQLAVHI